jgi:mono/diheme cytochrome c family protein
MFRTTVFAALALVAASPCLAQTAEEKRAIDYGREIFKNKAQCQFCHKWDGSGDQGYGGNALSLRATQLTRDQMAMVVKCGRPGTGMPFHDHFAYTDKRCYGMTREMAGENMPIAAINQPLNPSEIQAVVNYVFSEYVGRGPSTYEECVEFWGADTKQCEPMKK